MFRLPGRFVGAAPHGNGHINDTFIVATQADAGPARSILQRVNDRVFRNVPALMENLSRVTRHIGDHAPSRVRAPQPIPTRAGALWHQDAEGAYWRSFAFVDRATAHDRLADPRHAFEVARGFGLFQHALVDLPGPRLHETIPGFHDTRRRFEALRRAIAQDSAGRAAACPGEIAFAMDREALCDVLLDLLAAGALPERVAHNDAKPNNALLDDASGRCVCVIDLDTVMPGTALFDFGDLVRSATNAADEDERDLSLVSMRMEIFDGLARGYASASRSFLTGTERAHLAFVGKLITYENGLRFLADHLEGDVYYKIRRPSHNLDRCRNQFALVRSIEEQEPAMQAAVDRAFARD